MFVQALSLFAGFEADPYLRLELDGVYSEAEVEQGDDDVDASAIITEATAGLELENDQTEIELSAQAEYVEFSNPDFTDRVRYFARIGIEHEFDDHWELRLRAERSNRFPSVEFFDINETELRARLRFEPVRAHRFGAAFRWRERRYSDGSDASGDGPRIEGEYRYRFGRYHYLEFDARYEDIRSDDEFRTYDRQLVALTYTHPLARDLRVRPKFEWRVTDFPGRAVDDGGTRRDEQFTPEVEFLYWPGEWRTSAEFQYRRRKSNDPIRDFSGFRAQLMIAYVF